MYVFTDKILDHGISRNGKAFVIIRTEDYPTQAGLTRTTYCGTISSAKSEAVTDSFGNTSSPDRGYYVGVEVSRLQEVRPTWLLTNAALLAMYQAMQQDDRDTLNTLSKKHKVDITRDPDLKIKASALWSAHLETQVVTNKT
jgi:hypothetical protein